MEIDAQICETVANGGRFWRDAPRGIALGSGVGFRVERPSRIGLRWRLFRRSEHRLPVYDGNSSMLRPTVQTVACFEASTWEPLLEAKVGDSLAKVISDALKQATVCTGGHKIDELPSQNGNRCSDLRNYRQRRPILEGRSTRNPTPDPSAIPRGSKYEHRFPFYDGNSSILKPTVQTVACFQASTWGVP